MVEAKGSLTPHFDDIEPYFEERINQAKGEAQRFILEIVRNTQET
ncbi:MAG: hypothetical protein QS99_C0008G0027 [archaeon GW2011_AR4]|nr:MAG: hypothetical protein QS99_C0008G0027 [archaeon GW2011_AR4]